MKKYVYITAFMFLLLGGTVSAQKSTEAFGNTLNLGIGLGYYGYGYIGHFTPAFHLDYEFQVAPSFTLAPFITVLTYRNTRYWGNHNNPYQYYYYRQTVVPLGVKGTYYFDRLLDAGPSWDFYLAASAGIALRTTRWQNGYYGETAVQHGATGVYLDAHIGAEYHLNQKLGLFLDLSTGISTFGLAVHF